MILYGIVIIVHAIYSHEITRCSIEAGILIGVAVLLNRGTGFPIPKQPFGGIPPLPAIGIIFFCTILGTGGRYLFYKKGKFSWESFLKPVGIAPILFLPLIGAVKGISEFDFIQLLS